MLTEVVPRSSNAALTRLRPLLLEAAALAVLLAAAAWIFAIPLHDATNYDEGNYLAALTDLRHGFVLGKDVYADQPPGGICCSSCSRGCSATRSPASGPGCS